MLPLKEGRGFASRKALLRIGFQAFPGNRCLTAEQSSPFNHLCPDVKKKNNFGG